MITMRLFCCGILFLFLFVGQVNSKKDGDCPFGNDIICKASYCDVNSHKCPNIPDVECKNNEFNNCCGDFYIEDVVVTGLCIPGP